MQLFGNRLHNSHRRGTLSPLAIILIVAGAALLLTIVIGLLLNVWLDDEAYDRLTKGEQKEEETTENNIYIKRLSRGSRIFLKNRKKITRVGAVKIAIF